MPGVFNVYNGTRSLVGFIGTSAGVSGGWFKTLGIGGTSYSNAPIKTDASDNATLTNVTLTFNQNGVTSTFANNITTTGLAGATFTDNSSTINSAVAPTTFRVTGPNTGSGSGNLPQHRLPA